MMCHTTIPDREHAFCVEQLLRLDRQHKLEQPTHWRLCSTGLAEILVGRISDGLKDEFPISLKDRALLAV